MARNMAIASNLHRTRRGRASPGRFVGAILGACLGVWALLAAPGIGLHPARAEDKPATTIYPIANRVGLTPLPGLVLATTFPGFEDVEAKVKVVAAELPPQAFHSIEAAMMKGTQPTGGKRDKAEMFATQGGFGILSHESAKEGLKEGTKEDDASVLRWSVLLDAGHFTALITVQMPAGAAAKYPADKMRMMLASVNVRDEVPATEQLSKLPFKLSELADFRNVRTIVPGAAVLLSDPLPGENAREAADAKGATQDKSSDAVDGKSSPDKPSAKIAPYMILSVVPGGPERAEDRPRFADQAVYGIQGLSDVKITSSEPLRLGGQAGYETRFTALDAANGEAMSMVQWLRFGNSGFLLIIAGAPKDSWIEAYPRFRRVRDGIIRP